MFQRLITYSIHNKLVVGILTMALAVWGVWSLLHLPFDATPDITNNQVQVITLAPRLGAQEVEQYITTPVEMALANVPRVEERRSISRSGLSVITLVFDDNADIYWARSQVSEVLANIASDLPENTSTEMGPIATGLGEIFHYTVRAKHGYEDKYTLSDLRTIQDWIVRKQLSGTPGVAEVSGMRWLSTTTDSEPTASPWQTSSRHSNATTPTRAEATSRRTAASTTSAA